MELVQSPDSAPDPAPRYRAVLIGIDAYPRKPLDGCVNDIDQIERILLDRLGVPPERITRFAAPRAGAASSTRLPSSLSPTLAELRKYLEGLAEEVSPEDVVFLYYSGHGSRVVTEVNGQRIAREALVPMDFQNDDDPQRERLLYDFELNGLLARIAERAGDLTVVLDCCHSSSVDRGEHDRCLEIHGVQTSLPQSPGGGTLAKNASGLASAAAGHMLVAACRADESAYEVRPDETRPQQGAFSRVLVQILESADQPLTDLRWWDISIELMNRFSALDSRQHPLIVGREERRLFGGPWALRDLGYAVRQDAEGFHIGAGTLTGLSPDAEVAVYGAKPDRFPDLNTGQDRAARVGLLRVDKAERSSCTAVPIDGSFQLPEGARGRLVKPGQPDRLIVALEPFDSQLADRLEGQGIVAVPSGAAVSEARLRRENGRLHLDDETGDTGWLPLVSFPADKAGLAEAVLGHYALIRRTLRLPARCSDLAGALKISLMAVPERLFSPEELQAPRFNELPSGKPWKYKVREGDGFVVRIENRAKDALEVFLLNCAGSGRIEHLGSAQIPAGAVHVLWTSKKLGIPFYPTVATEQAETVDRLIVVGTTLPDQDLAYLSVDESFAELIQRYPDRDAKDMGKDMGNRSLPTTLVERWTAEMITLRIYK